MPRIKKTINKKRKIKFTLKGGAGRRLTTYKNDDNLSQNGNTVELDKVAEGLLRSRLQRLAAERSGSVSKKSQISRPIGSPIDNNEQAESKKSANDVAEYKGFSPPRGNVRESAPNRSPEPKVDLTSSNKPLTHSEIDDIDMLRAHAEHAYAHASTLQTRANMHESKANIGSLDTRTLFEPGVEPGVKPYFNKVQSNLDKNENRIAAAMELIKSGRADSLRSAMKIVIEDEAKAKAAKTKANSNKTKAEAAKAKAESARVAARVAARAYNMTNGFILIKIKNTTYKISFVIKYFRKLRNKPQKIEIILTCDSNFDIIKNFFSEKIPKHINIVDESITINASKININDLKLVFHPEHPFDNFKSIDSGTIQIDSNKIDIEGIKIYNMSTYGLITLDLSNRFSNYGKQLEINKNSSVPNAIKGGNVVNYGTIVCDINTRKKRMIGFNFLIEYVTNLMSSHFVFSVEIPSDESKHYMNHIFLNSLGGRQYYTVKIGTKSNHIDILYIVASEIIIGKDIIKIDGSIIHIQAINLYGGINPDTGKVMSNFEYKNQTEGTSHGIKFLNAYGTIGLVGHVETFDGGDRIVYNDDIDFDKEQAEIEAETRAQYKANAKAKYIKDGENEAQSEAHAESDAQDDAETRFKAKVVSFAQNYHIDSNDIADARAQYKAKAKAKYIKDGKDLANAETQSDTDAEDFGKNLLKSKTEKKALFKAQIKAQVESLAQTRREAEAKSRSEKAKEDEALNLGDIPLPTESFDSLTMYLKTIKPKIEARIRQLNS